eukprot:TRINITY_DN9866_c0_g1_i1.p1 TRINITY_DN9866_c0_g1~~TRINITY_DN9866_c0_g1_i1.p1  ORF type:complete len:204 (-),score=31.73 TRINITY_DN9866_c0_g1_i1:105-716(-)
MKKFFWASSDFKFAELPECNLTYKEYLENIRYLFTGMQQNKLAQLDAELNPDYKQLPKTNLTELDRLSFVVNQIETDCQLIPIGGLQMTPTKEFQYNQSFRGLSIYESQELKNYQHFRQQRSEEKQKQIERGDYLFKFDFLDSLDNDLPIGAWSIQSDTSKTIVTLRNLVWTGYIGYHRTNSNIFGGVYFGQAIKNNDLPFLL